MSTKQRIIERLEYWSGGEWSRDQMEAAASDVIGITSPLSMPAHPTWIVQRHVELACAEFCVNWTQATRLSIVAVKNLLEEYFEGIDVEITRFHYGPNFRNGFDIRLNSLPRERHMECGQKPEDVSPERPLIIVTADDRFFHAQAMASIGPASALAVGLNLFVAEHVRRRQASAPEALRT